MPRTGRRCSRNGPGRLGRGGAGRGRPVDNMMLVSSRSQQNSGFIGFTLADEARQTSQHDHSTWGENSILRKRPVAFVNAGFVEPLKLLDHEVSNHKQPNINQPSDSAQEGIVSFREDAAVAPKKMNASDDDSDIVGPEELDQLIQVPQQPESNANDLFFFDLKPQRPSASVRTPIVVPDRSSPSPEESSSSDDIIVFKGRESRRARIHNPVNLPLMTTTHVHTDVGLIKEHSDISPTGGQPQSTSWSEKKSTNNRGTYGSGISTEDAVLADYIANLEANGEMDNLFSQRAGNRRDLGGSLPSSPTESEVDNEVEIRDGPVIHDDNGIQGQIEHRFGGINIDEQPDTDENSSNAENPIPPRKAQGRQLLDGFDPMDWERPSLRRKKGKGKRANINFDASDSELEMKLQAVWRADRLKKSERKQQREKQRALGLLGKNTDPEDLRVKYPTGMTLDQIAEELKLFLIGNDQSITLPPMDKHARKIVHDLANKFNIKSKSTGNKETRRPTLYRTGRTLPFTDKTFRQVIGRVHRRYFPRIDQRGKQGQNGLNARSAGYTGVSYREGEVVGGEAPELGNSNRGRAILEKMGWSSGTALGAMDNKGILQPVSQTMKKSKAGLG